MFFVPVPVEALSTYSQRLLPYLKEVQAISNKVVQSIIDCTIIFPSKDIHDYKSDSNNFWFFGK